MHRPILHHFLFFVLFHKSTRRTVLQYLLPARAINGHVTGVIYIYYNKKINKLNDKRVRILWTTILLFIEYRFDSFFVFIGRSALAFYFFSVFFCCCYCSVIFSQFLLLFKLYRTIGLQSAKYHPPGIYSFFIA